MLKRSRLVFAIALLALLPAQAPSWAQEGNAPAESQGSATTQQAPAPDTQPQSGTGAAPSGNATTAPQTVQQDNAAPAGAGEEDPATVLDDVDGDEAAGADERQAGLPHDLSPWGMFMAADIVVKAVMVGLAFASVVTWTVLIAKLMELAAVQRAVRKAVRQLIAAKGLRDAEEALGNSRGIAARMTRAAREEMESSEQVIDHVSDGGIKERVASRLSRMEVHAGRQIAKGTGLLATIGSTAPFVGLFGTVWGIMNSFIGISQAQTTNLAIVAPGIAEALLATAIGLVAAIPAVVIYNFLARAITGYRHGLADASAAIERLVSRDLDVRRTLRVASQRNAERSGAKDPSIVRIG
ncbi:MAG: tonB-system energizer ExbB [Shinella sp.]|nr:tonB-system energizer ExbB [Shinella sp.]